jgi:RHS repeat-associated protein
MKRWGRVLRGAAWSRKLFVLLSVGSALASPAFLPAQTPPPLAVFASDANLSAGSKVIDMSSGHSAITGRIHCNSDIDVSGTANYFRTGVVEYVTGIHPTPNFQGKVTLQDCPVVASTVQPFPVTYQQSDFAPGGSAALAAQAAGEYYHILGDTHLTAFMTNGILRKGLYYIEGNLNLSQGSLHGQVTFVATGTIIISGPGETWQPYTQCLLAFSTKTLPYNNSAINISGGSSQWSGVLFAPNGGVQISGSGNTITGGALMGLGVELTGSTLNLTGIDFSTCSGTPTNQAPIVYAGQDQALNLHTNTITVALAGSVADDGLPTGGNLESLWSLVSGPAPVIFGDPTLTNTTVTLAMEGIYVFALTADDSALTNSDVVRVTFNRTNNPPVAYDQSITNLEETTAAIVLEGSDPDGDPLTFSIITPPAFGAISGSESNVFYTPKPGYFGPDSFTFKVSDGFLESAVATVSITNLHVNHAPLAEPQAIITPEETATNMVLTGSDADCDALTFTIAAGPTNGTLVGSGSTYTYTPKSNYFGADAFSFTANDGFTNSAPALVNITVTPVDKPPLVDAGPDQLISLPQNTTQLAGTVVYEDFTNTVDTVIWSQLSGPGTATFTDASNETTTVTFSQSGVYELQLVASDSYFSGTNGVRITVNAPPAVSAGSGQTNTLPGSITLSGVVTDDGLPTNGILSVLWSEISGPGTAIFADPHVTNTTVEFSQSGFYTLRLTANDGAISASNHVTVLMNDAPLVDAGSAQLITNLQAALNGTVFDDPYPNNSLHITWSQVSGPGIATFADSSAPITTVTFSQPGVYVLQLAADDSLVISSNQVTISVDGPPAVAASGDLLVLFPGTANLTATATNDDALPPNAVLTQSWSQVSGPGTVTFADASALSTTASFSLSGVYVVQFQASDTLLSAATNLTITVDQAPVVSAGADQVVTYPQSATLNGSATDDGLPNNTLTYSWVKVSGPGTANFADAASASTTVSFSSAGVYVLQLTASDSFANGTSQVTVRANNAPVALGQTVTLVEDSATNLVLQATDADGQTLNYSIVSPPAHGTLTVQASANQFLYAPTANYVGDDSFTFKVNDGYVDSPPATVALTILSRNDPPSFVAGANQVSLEDAGPQTIAAWASNISAGPANESSQTVHFLVSADNPALFSAGPSIASDGTLTYTAATNANGTASVIVRAQDNGGTANGGVDTSAPQSFTITVTAVNDPPRLTIPGSQTIGDALPLVFNTNRLISLSDVDAGQGALQLSLGVAHGTITLGSTNGLVMISGADSSSNLVVSGTLTDLNGSLSNLTYTSTLHYSGAETLALSVDDLGNTGEGGPMGDFETVAITVVPTNHAPVFISTPITNTTPIILRSTQRFDAQTIDLSRWTYIQLENLGQGPANWVLSQSNPVAVQTLNADPSVLLGDFSMFRDRIQGNFQVNSTDDDDFIGFVFGFQNTSNFYLFDWKEVDQSVGADFGERGMSVKVVTGPTPDTWTTFATNSLIHTIYHNTIPWQPFTNYQFTLDFQPGDFTITVNNGTNVLSTIHLNDTTYPNGKFGFYNSSQDSVRYSGFTEQRGTAQSYVYQAVATDPDSDPVTYSIVNGPTNMTINPTNGSIQWLPDITFTGTVSVTIRATDNHGGTSDQIFNIFVPPPLFNKPPFVNAGPDRAFYPSTNTITLNGTVVDDGLPTNTLTIQWNKMSGPGTVTFGNSTSPITTATFSTNGIYVLQLSGSDSMESSNDTVVVRADTVCSVEPPPGMVAWWPADFSEEDKVSAVRGFNQNVTFPAGKVASAFGFNGTDSIIGNPAQTTHDVGTSASGFTMEFWMNVGTFLNSGVLGWANGVRVERFTSGTTGDSLHFYVSGTNSGQFINSSQIWRSGAFFGQWVHIAMTYDRPTGLASIYFNGILNASGNVGTNVLSTAGDFDLGQVPGSAGVLTGQLDEVTLYNRPLNPEEIFNIFSAGAVGKCPNDGNTGPRVYAGPDVVLTGLPGATTLQGEVTDDGSPSPLRSQWSKVSGPGAVTFANSNSVVTGATFSTNGIYVLRLTADDGEVQTSDLVEVRVETRCIMADPQGLAAWWPGNGTEMEALNGYDAIVADGLGYTAGEVATAFSFNGVNQFIQMPARTNYDVGASTSGFTIEYWININTFFNSAVLGWANGVRVERFQAGTTGDSLHFYVGGTNSGQFLDSQQIWRSGHLFGQWVHIAMTYERPTGLAHIYLNGILNASGNAGTNVMTTASDFYLGQVPGSAGLLTGGLDEVSLYGRPLNPEEVFNLFKSGSVGKCPQDGNAPPLVYAGPDLFITGSPGVGTLEGSVIDDGQPAGSSLKVAWSTFAGPGTVVFANSNSPTTTATFSTNGVYVLQLTGDDGEYQISDLVEVRVESVCLAQNTAALSAWWPANGTSVDVISGQEAVLVDGASYTTGKVASAFQFDGNPPYILAFANTNYDIGSSTNGFTLEFWAKAAFTSFSRSILSWNNGYSGGNSNGVWMLESGASLVINLAEINGATHQITAGGIFNGNWRHIALTYNRPSGVAQVYVDGVLQLAQNIGSFEPQTTYDLAFGQVLNVGPFLGQLDEISLYRRPLSPIEILSLYQSGSVGKCPEDSNRPPLVYAGPDFAIASTNVVANLNGVAADDGLPAGSTLRVQWKVLDGPGIVNLANSNSALTTASFSTNGIYTLQLTADDGEEQSSDFVEVRVGLSCPVLDMQGLAAWWPANGITVDKISGIPAVLVNGAAFSPGKVAGSFQFNGTNDYVTIPAQTNYDIGKNTNGFTIEYWEKAVFSSPQRGVFSWNNSSSGGTANGVLMIQNGSSGTFIVVDSGGAGHSLSSVTPIFDGNWHLLDLTYDRPSGTAKVFLDGALKLTQTIGSFLALTSSDLQLGRVLGNPGFIGQLDEMSLYTRPLAQSEIQAVFNAGAVGKCVTPSNTPPVVSAGPDQVVSLPNSVTLNGTVFDDGLPSNNLVIAWSYVAGDSTVFFSNTNAAVTTVTFTNAGTYTFQLSASDGQFTTNDTVTVTVLPDLRARPTVTVTAPADQSLFDVSATGTTNLTFTASAADADGQVTNVQFFLNGSSVGSVPAAPYSLVASNLPPANYSITAIATDNDGLSTTSAPVAFLVYVDPGQPDAAIFLPTDSTIVTAPTNIIGTASSSLLASYQVRYRLAPVADDTSIPTDSNGWTTLTNGGTSVVSNTLATFDPTLLLNGIYQVQVVANDLLGRTSFSEATTLVVDRNLKIGNFTLSFSDLTVPVAGVPIEIVRTYDSRDQRTNDFGVGWSLDIRNVRLQKNRNLGPAWFEDSTGGSFPTYFMDSVNDRDLTVTLANGREFKFTAKFSPESRLDVPIQSGIVTYQPTPDTYAKLESVRGDDVEVSGSIPGPVDLFDVQTGGFFNPSLFKLTTEEGEVYIIDENEGLKSLTDRNGNTLLVTTNGVVWTNTITGGPSVGVTFVRDPEGRISQIIDPQGNALNYGYGTNGSLASFTDRETNTTTFAYTNLAFPHYLTGITDPRGVQAIRTEYDDSGRMIRQTDASGNVVQFTHDLSNNREIIRDRLGNVTIHEYDDDGNIVRTTDPLGNITTSKYDANDNLLEQVDALGNTNSYTYDSKGNKLTETDPLGFTTRYTYGPLRTLTSLTNPRGFTTTNSYNPDTGELLQQMDPLGNVTSYSYDGNGNLLTRTDALGNVMSNLYDNLGHMTNTTVIDAVRGVLNSTAFTYDTNGNQLSKSITRTTPHGPEVLTTSYTYDKENRLVETTRPDGSTNVTIFAVGLNKPAAEIDPLGRQTLHYYDERGNLTNTIYADGTSESFRYDAENRKVAMTDRAGRLMAYNFDALARMTNTVFADGAVSNVVYDAIGRVIVTADERGNATHYAYDPNCGCSGRQAFITNALGQVTHRSYDEDANESSMIDALGRTLTYSYDALDRRTNILYIDGSFSSTTYDAIGRRIAETDQSTNTTRFAYDALGRLIAVTNALGKATTYSYDEVGSLVSQTDANNHTTTFEYDSLGRRTKRTLPLGQIETYQYDFVSELTNKTDFNGHSTGYGYDALGRLLSKTPDAFFSAPTVTFTYTATGQRATMSDAGGATVYHYNSRDWLTNKTWTPVGQASSLSLNYTYSSNGNLTTIQSSTAGGTAVSYEYDVLNRLDGVNDAHVGCCTEYGYDAVGNLQTQTYPNGINTTYQYDLLNRLTNLTTLNGSSGLVAKYSYTVAPTGHRLTAAENVVVTNSVRTINRIFTYDATYRLTHESLSASGPISLPASANVGYALDDVGNRLSRTTSGFGPGTLASTASTYDANDRLTSDTYDANGNTKIGHVPAGSAAVNDVYDFEDHLVSRNNGQVTVTYDGDGNRVAKTVGGVTTLFLVDDRNPSGYAQVLEEHVVVGAQSPTLNRAYTYGSDLISEDQWTGTAWTVSFYGYDGHGNVRYLTDTNAAVTDTYDYDAFGTLIAQYGTTPNNYLYCGEQFDGDLGLYYNRARYLNTDSGRFWTMDKFEGDRSDMVSLHKYLYAGCDPIGESDPSGMVEEEIPEAQAIDAQLEKSVKNTGIKIGKKIIKKIACEIVPGQVVAGVYVIVISKIGGEGAYFYIGQSKDVIARLSKWTSELLKSGEVARLVKVIEVAGGNRYGAQKLIRELVETVLIEEAEINGVPLPGNSNSPIDPANIGKRLNDPQKQIDDYTKKLFKKFFPGLCN